MAKGIAEGQRHLLLTLVTARFGAPSAKLRRRVAKADTAQLERWSTQLLTAQRLDEVFS